MPFRSKRRRVLKAMVLGVVISIIVSQLLTYFDVWLALPPADAPRPPMLRWGY
jgi:hypothetical protein